MGAATMRPQTKIVDYRCPCCRLPLLGHEEGMVEQAETPPEKAGCERCQTVALLSRVNLQGGEPHYFYERLRRD